MRLTLRTMLAYLDGVLSPTDAESLGSKIHESDTAAQLVQRIRGSVARLQLAAPKVDAKGMAGDANTVAEYLDSTLPMDRVADFERVCLESDSHLAEVSACHQILAVVLSQPAEVAPHLRERVYQVGGGGTLETAVNSVIAGEGSPNGHASASQREESSSQTDVASSPEAVSQTTTAEVGGRSLFDSSPSPPPEPPASEAAKEPPKPARPKPEVPEYLRASRRSRLWPLALTLLLAFLAVGLFLRALGPFDESHPLAMMVAPQSEEVEAVEPREEELGAALPQAGDDEQTSDDDANIEVEATDSAGDAAITAELGDEDRADDVGGEATAAGANEETTDEETVDEDAMDIDVSPPSDASEDSGSDEATTSQEEQGSGSQSSEVAAIPDDLGAAPEEAESEDPMDAESSPPREAGEMDEPSESGDVAGAEETADAASAVGRFTSDEEVLARSDDASGLWYRVPTRDSVVSGDRLLAFPTYRPQILLSSGVQVSLVGPAAIELGLPGDEGASSVALPYGQALLLPVNREGMDIDLKLAGKEGRLTFADIDSAAAVQVDHFLPPGQNPEENPAAPVVRLFATSGGVEWLPEGDDTAASINAGEVHQWTGDAEAETVAAGELPAWIDSRNLGDIQRRASNTLEPLIDAQRPLGLTVAELAQDRRAEVRVLAVLSAAQLDSFGRYADVLGDESLRSSWAAFFEALRGAISRSPETAARVRVAFEKAAGADGATMYRLLWMYSDAQLAGGAAAELVELLDHEKLPVRVLAFENLRRTVGSSLLYRPEHTESRRKSSVMRWRERLEEGAIRWQEPLQAISSPTSAADDEVTPAETSP